MAKESGVDLRVVVALAAVGAGVYLVSKVWGLAASGAKAVGAGASALYHGAQTLTDPIASGIAKLWSPGATAQVPGNVIFPDGYGGPLSTYKVYSDPSGNVFVKDRGSTWQLGQSDANGDWPATYVSG